MKIFEHLYLIYVFFRIIFSDQLMEDCDPQQFILLWL